MSEFLLAHESQLRLGTYIGVLTLMVLLETIFARRKRVAPRRDRWVSNIGVAAINSALVGLVLPILAVGMAFQAAENGWGLFNLVDLPPLIEIIGAFVLLDFAIWFQHVIFHKVPFLWRLHAMHHVDQDLDATSGVRFHPVEILLSAVLKLGLVIIIGPAAVAVLLFEVILNASALFNHANLNLPLWLDRALRLVIVTPDMHRAHHSPYRDETDTNYGFFLSVWDRLFKTYTIQPREDHETMRLGLDEAPELRDTIYLRMLSLPIWLGQHKASKAVKDET